jgi:hypothetical protein
LALPSDGQGSGVVSRPLAVAACAIAFSLGVFPIWLTTQEFWDGAISSYAILTGDLSGAQLHFPELNWFISHAFVWLAERVYQLWGVPGWLSIKGWLTLMIIGMAVEAARLGRRLFNLGAAESIWVMAAVFAFPAWYAYFSYTPMIGHVTGAFLVMLGHRWIHGSDRARHWAGWPLLAVSFQLNSALAFVMALEACYWLLRRGEGRWSYLRTAGIFVLAVGTYAGLRLAFPPRGLNVGYNSILNPLALESWKTWFTYSAGYATWLTLLLPSVLGWAWLQHRQGGGFVSLRESRVSRPLTGLVVLFAGACIAYIAVGKGHALFVPGWGATGSVGVALARSVDDGRWFYPFVSLWSARHLILFTVPCAIASVWLLVQVDRRPGDPVVRNGVMLFLGISLAYQLVWALQGHANRLERAAQAQALVLSLHDTPPPGPGTVDIELPAHAGYAIQLHESNFLMWRAYGATRWATVAYPPVPLAREAVIAERNSMLALKPETNRPVRMLCVMEQYTGAPCHTVLRVSFPDFNWADLLWRAQFLPHRLPRATLTVVGQQCKS